MKLINLVLLKCPAVELYFVTANEKKKKKVKLLNDPQDNMPRFCTYQMQANRQALQNLTRNSRDPHLSRQLDMAAFSRVSHG